MQEFLKNYHVSEDGTVTRTRASASNYGNVLAIVGKTLKHDVAKNGYSRVTLCCNGKSKRFLVHRLVALIYLPNPDNLPIVSHIDGDPSNNHVSNLVWCTYSHSLQHSYDSLGRDKRYGTKRKYAKLKESNIPNIRQMADIGHTQRYIASLYGVSRSTIGDVIHKRSWTHVN